MDFPQVSILIPTFNRELFMDECVQSALEQTYTDLEVVIVDNASTDQTWAICQRYAAQDSRVRIFRNETNIGPVRNWQRCLTEARGSYAKILFSDDKIYPTYLERTVPLLAHFDQVGFVFSAADIYGIKANPTGVTLSYPYPKQPTLVSAQEYLQDFLIHGVSLPVSPGAGLFRLSDLRKNLLTHIPHTPYDDWAEHGAGPDVLTYLLTACDYPLIAHVSEPLVFFRAHLGSFSTAIDNTLLNQRYNTACLWFVQQRFPHWIKQAS